jgi:hypothetical protein
LRITPSVSNHKKQFTIKQKILNEINMKKTFIVVGVLAGAVGAYAQGELQWNDGQNNFDIAILSPNPANPTVEQTGNTSFDLPGGGATYGGGWIGGGAAPGGGVGATSASGPGAVDYQNNALFEVGIYMASSQQALTAAIQSGSPLATSGIQGGGNAGLYSTSALTVTDPNDASSAWVGIAAWYTGGSSSINSYASAVTAQDPTGFVESSGPVTIGSAPSPAGNLQGGDGLTSFSLATTTPEPSTIALGVIGASAFLMRLRRKQ